MPERVLVTGALGCLGAWTIKALLDEGDEPVGYDLGTDDARLRLVLDEDERERVTLVQGDIADGDALGRALDEHEIGRVVHLAALQVPFCRANPRAGARVNVLGTVALFEAVKARRDRIPGARLRELDGGLQRRRSLAGARVGRHEPRDALRRLQARERGDGPRRSGPTTASRRSASGRTSSTGRVATRA